MTPRQAVRDFLLRHIAGLVVGAFAIGGAYAALQAQVYAKADKVAVERELLVIANEMRSIAHEIRALVTEVRSMKVLICRDNPDDSQCAGAPGVATRSRSTP